MLFFKIQDVAVANNMYTSGLHHDSHDFHDKIFVDFLAESTIFDAFLEVK